MSWFRLERGWQDSEFFMKKNLPYNEREAWVWMIGEACWKDVKKSVLGGPLTIKRGQFSHSLRFMAIKFQWTIDEVRGYLNRLKKWEMITIDNPTGQNIVTICNYSKYQDEGNSNSHSNSQAIPTPLPQDAHKEEELNTERKKEKKKVTPSFFEDDSYPVFEKIWEIYPRQRRGNKIKMKRAYLRALTEKRATEEEIYVGLEKYRISDEVERGYAKGAEAWLNADGWANSYKPPRRDDKGQKPSYMDRLHTAAKNACDTIDREMQLDAGGMEDEKQNRSGHASGRVQGRIAHQPARNNEALAERANRSFHEEGSDWIATSGADE